MVRREGFGAMGIPYEMSDSELASQAVASKPEKVPEELLGPVVLESLEVRLLLRRFCAKHMPYLCVYGI